MSDIAAVGSVGLSRSSLNLKCTYCERFFSRTEHVIRHERSHRNEKPFQCSLCSASFTRKDVYKKHFSRLHSSTSASITSPTTSGLLDHSQSISSQNQNQRGRQIEPVTPESRGSNHGVSPHNDHGFPDIDSIADQIFANIDLVGAANSDAFDDHQSEPPLGLSLGMTAPENAFTSHFPVENTASTPPQTTWEGSFAISRLKRDCLVADFDSINDITGENANFQFPTRFAFERLLHTFSENFLIYLPCIHLATWKAETAHPCLLLAMASIGASYYEDYTTANVLLMAARQSMTNYLCSSPRPISSQPLWVFQAILFIMANDTRSANFEICNSALSWTSPLSDAVRFGSAPHIPIIAQTEKLLSRWQSWVEFETAVRTKCAIYVYMSALNITFQMPPTLQNSDMMEEFLPGSDEEWECATPCAWSEIQQRSQQSSLRFAEALKSIISPETSSPQTRFTGYAAYTILHALVKRTGTLQQDYWPKSLVLALLHTAESSLDRWRTCSDNILDIPVFLRSSRGAINMEAASLYRLAYVRLCGDFGPLRSAIATHEVDKIFHCMGTVKLRLTRDEMCLRAARCSIDALRVPVKLGMALSGSIPKMHQKLLFTLYSVECCMFLSIWIRDQFNRPEFDQTSEEWEVIRLTQETLQEIDLESTYSQKSIAVQILYAWAVIMKLSTASGLHKVLADALLKYASTIED